jgi:hypothetical protein
MNHVAATGKEPLKREEDEFCNETVGLTDEMIAA